MVGPQKLNPCALSAFAIRRETSVSVAMPARFTALPSIGAPSTKSHRKREKPGPLSSILR